MHMQEARRPLPLWRTAFASSFGPFYPPLVFLLLILFRIAISYAERFPLAFVFEAMLDAVTVMEFVKSFGLDEHLVTFEQTMNTGLTGLGALLTFEFSRVTGKVVSGFLVRRDVAFIVSQDDLVIGHAQQVIGHDRNFSTASGCINNILRHGIAGSMAAQAFHDLDTF